MYRPKDWKNPYEPIGADLNKMGNEIAFEAGADAMLEALKKCGVYGQYTEGVYEGPWLVDDDGSYFGIEDVVSGENKKGHLVFIPDEEEKENG